MLQFKASKVHLAVRTLAKGHAARESLLADPLVKEDNPAAIVTVYEVDYGSFESVVMFSKKFQAENETLDILVLNAGVVMLDYVTSASGYEMVVQVNHLSTALLSLLFLPILEATAKATNQLSMLSIMSSTMHKRTPFGPNLPPNTHIIDYLNDKKNFQALDRYSVSKLLICMWVRELATHVDPSGVIVNNVCPGSVCTNLTHNLPFYMKPVAYLMQFNGTAVDEGARSLTHAAVVAGKETHGEFIFRGKITSYSDFVLSKQGEEMQKRLWTETNDILEKASPGVSSVL